MTFPDVTRWRDDLSDAAHSDDLYQFRSVSQVTWLCVKFQGQPLEFQMKFGKTYTTLTAQFPTIFISELLALVPWYEMLVINHTVALSVDCRDTNTLTHCTRASVDPDLCRQGVWINIKMSSYQYRKSHCGDETILRPSYLHNGISYTGKTTSLYWIGVQIASLGHNELIWCCDTKDGTKCPKNLRTTFSIAFSFMCCVFNKMSLRSCSWVQLTSFV